jgi:hypothetical protein
MFVFDLTYANSEMESYRWDHNCTEPKTDLQLLVQRVYKGIENLGSFDTMEPLETLLADVRQYKEIKKYILGDSYLFFEPKIAHEERVLARMDFIKPQPRPNWTDGLSKRNE